MSRLPNSDLLIQQIGERVILYRGYTDEEIISFNPRDHEQMGQALKDISDSDLPEEAKYFAHFWSGYFYGRSA